MKDTHFYRGMAGPVLTYHTKCRRQDTATKQQVLPPALTVFGYQIAARAEI